MNNLSWLLFWADVAPQISSALCYASFLLSAILGFAYMFGVTNMFGEGREDDLTMRRLRNVRPWLLGCIAVWSSTWLVPDERETYYAIAASEVGEDLLNTPEIGRARQALNNWLDKQLEEEVKDEPAAE